MELEIKLEKIRNEISILVEKEKDFKIKLKEKRSEEKKLLEEIELENLKVKAEKNEKIVSILSENFGEITEENFSVFVKIMQENKEQLIRSKERISNN